MCVVKTPKVKDDGSTNKELPILRNPILDGIDPATSALRIGRSSLRIDRAAPGAAGASATNVSAAAPAGATPSISTAPAGAATLATLQLGGGRLTSLRSYEQFR